MRVVAACLALLAASTTHAAGIPAPMAYAPDVPPPISRSTAETLVVHIETRMTPIALAPGITYDARAERLGWLRSVDDWLAVRKPRYRMIHEYVRDATEMAAALTFAHGAVALLLETAAALATRATQGLEAPRK